MAAPGFGPRHKGFGKSNSCTYRCSPFEIPVVPVVFFVDLAVLSGASLALIVILCYEPN